MVNGQECLSARVRHPRFLLFHSCNSCDSWLLFWLRLTAAPRSLRPLRFLFLSAHLCPSVAQCRSHSRTPSSAGTFFCLSLFLCRAVSLRRCAFAPVWGKF